MKKKIFLVTFLIGYFVGYSQVNFQGTITYHISTKDVVQKKLDTATPPKGMKNKKMNAWFRKIMKGGKAVNGFLKFTNGEAIYQLEDKMNIDGEKTLNMTRMIAGGDNIYYRNTTTNNNFYQTGFDELLLIDLEPIKWKITQETKRISKYVCYKAIDMNSKNKIQKTIAWFTPKIPINFGPKHYFGLPGLILEVDTYGSLTTATNIVLNPKKKIKIKKPTKGKKMTAKEYTEMGRKFFKKLDRQIKRNKGKN